MDLFPDLNTTFAPGKSHAPPGAAEAEGSQVPLPAFLIFAERNSAHAKLITVAARPTLMTLTTTTTTPTTMTTTTTTTTMTTVTVGSKSI